MKKYIIKNINFYFAISTVNLYKQKKYAWAKLNETIYSLFNQIKP